MMTLTIDTFKKNVFVGFFFFLPYFIKTVQWVSVCVEPILAYFPVRFNQFNSHLSIWEVIEKIRGRKEPSRSSSVIQACSI